MEKRTIFVLISWNIERTDLFCDSGSLSLHHLYTFGFDTIDHWAVKYKFQVIPNLYWLIDTETASRHVPVYLFVGLDLFARLLSGSFDDDRTFCYSNFIIQ